jgi:hypothetical protein
MAAPDSIVAHALHARERACTSFGVSLFFSRIDRQSAQAICENIST